MVVQRLMQTRAQLLAALADIGQQIVFGNGALDGQRGGARRGMADIGVAVLEEAAAATMVS